MDQDKILKYGILVGLFAVLIVPFVIANSMFFPYITGKNILFRVIIEIIFAGWLVLAFRDPKYRPKFSWVLCAVFLFTFILLLADSFAVAPQKAFFSNFERMDGWITTIHLLMYLVVFGTVMNTEKLWLWFFRASVFSSVIMSGYVFADKLAERVSGPLGNPIYMAIFFLFNFFFALFLFYKDVVVERYNLKDSLWVSIKRILSDWLSYVYIVALFLCAFGIYRTATRGVILGLVGGLVVSAIIIALFENKYKFVRYKAIGGLVLIVILVSGFFAVKNTSFVQNNFVLKRFADISWSNVNGQARQYVWPMALKGFKEKPILGWGQDGFNYVFNKYYDARMYAQEQWFDRAHNMPLDMLVAGGILGLLSYLAIFAATLWLIWRKRSKFDITEKALLIGLLAGYFFQNLFVFDNLVSYFLFFVVLAFVYFKDTESLSEKEIKSKNFAWYQTVLKEDMTNYVITPVVVVILLGSLWFFNYKPFIANTSLIQAVSSQTEGAKKNLEYFKKAISYSEQTFGQPEAREQLASIIPQVVSSQLSQEIKQNFAKFAFEEIQKQIEKTPDDVRYQFFMAQFFSNIGQYKYALSFYEKALEISPQKQTFYFDLVSTYINLGDRDKALETAKTAYELEVNYPEAKSVYATAAILDKKENIVKDLFGNSTTTDDRIMRAYIMSASEKAALGDKNGAIVQINKAINLNPDFKTIGTKLIDDVLVGKKQLSY